MGGIGLVHRLAGEIGLIDAIDRRLHLLKIHMPYHESDHVLNLAYNALCDGTRLEDIELRRNDEVFLDALGTERIPDPTTAGDFCRRFDEGDIRSLMRAADDARLNVWARQPKKFFDRATIDLDGTLVVTTGECKAGMDISYKGTWGYHPLLVTLAETGEVLRLVNRSGNRPSHEGAAVEADEAIDLCRRAGFRKMVLRGDTAFSQSERLDAWDADGVTFYFGFKAMPNLEEIAENLPKTAWNKLLREPRYEVQTETRRKPPNVKQRIIRLREFEVLRLQGEDYAEFEYMPTACKRSYRMIVLRKNISHEKGEKRLFDEIRYFFYITNDWADRRGRRGVRGQRPLQSRKSDRPVGRRRAGVVRAGGQSLQQLGVHGDDRVGVEPQSVVGVVAAGGWPLEGRASGRRSTRCCGWSSRRS